MGSPFPSRRRTIAAESGERLLRARQVHLQPWRNPTQTRRGQESIGNVLLRMERHTLLLYRFSPGLVQSLIQLFKVAELRVVNSLPAVLECDSDYCLVSPVLSTDDDTASVVRREDCVIHTEDSPVLGPFSLLRRRLVEKADSRGARGGRPRLVGIAVCVRSLRLAERGAFCQRGKSVARAYGRSGSVEYFRFSRWWWYQDQYSGI